jgi:hypothetical protein
MQIKHGGGKSSYGPGVEIDLSGDEIAAAIDLWLYSQGVIVNGPRTIRVNGELCGDGWVYVDPSGSVISSGKRFNGNGTFN